MLLRGIRRPTDGFNYSNATESPGGAGDSVSAFTSRSDLVPCSRTQFPSPALLPHRPIPSTSDGMASVPWATSWHVTSPHLNQTLPPSCYITAPCRRHRNSPTSLAHRLPKSLPAQLNWLPSVMLYLPIWPTMLLCRAYTTSSQRRCRYGSFLYFTNKQSHSPLGNTTLQSKDFRRYQHGESVLDLHLQPPEP